MPGEPILAPAVIPDEQPKVPEKTGSNIQAAAGVLEEKGAVHADAVKNLAGGRRRRRTRRTRRTRRRRTLRGGAVEVKNVPTFATAGGTDPKASYAGILETAHAAKAAGAYDGMGDKPPIDMNSMGGGRRRRKRSTVKRNNGGKRSTLLRSRRTRRGSRRVRHSRS